ncbi:MAG: preprotein translocase subunit YajC [Bdellovibrionota bacterium]
MKKILLYSTVMFSLGVSGLLAQEQAPAAEAPNAFSPLIGIVLMLAVFFFLIILPQSRKAKKQAQFLSSLEKGDEVVTVSGLYGKIYGLTERIVTLEIAPNVRIRVDRNSIASKDQSDSSSKAVA